MIHKTSREKVPSSFRDPAGYLYTEQDTLYRQINPSGYEDYFALIDSGLYEELIFSNSLIPHEEQDQYDQTSPPHKIIIKPEPLAFISYPYEWSFSQLKDAALLTLDIQLASLEKGMSLKDCSAYNIQFHNGRPILIDTLSFERYQEGEPWVAYRQFCQHFLCPLALMAYTDVRLSQLARIYIDGIPLDLASKLLPKKTSLNFALNMHIHMHAKSQLKYADKEFDQNNTRRKMQKHQLLGLVENLRSTTEKLTWQPGNTDWADYTQFHNYSPTALKHKSKIVADFLRKTQSEIVWDLGANTGRFSRLASQQKIITVAFDVDPGAVELNYLKAVNEGDQYLLPLITDLTNPSPGIGWTNTERQSLVERGPADTVLALAIVHHIVVGNNVPLRNLVDFLGSICNWLVIEFVPKKDPQVSKLLQVRKDIFTDYDRTTFIKEFNFQYELIAQAPIEGTDREIFLFHKRNSMDR